MDYEKLYKEALERAKYYQKENGSAVISAIFPELKESEDERIRKELIKETKGCEVRLFETVTNDEFIAWLEKQGEQKPTDTVEPKFKVGDWVVLYPSEIEVNRKVVQISRIERCQLNMYWTTEGTWFGDGTDARLWTIQDAKNGDVLVYHNTATEIIMLFKSWVVDRVAAYTHFHIFDNDFRVNNSCDCGNGAHPATKEQRDLLFQKMKEEGYEWDADKKELRKCEQKPTDTVEPKFKVRDWVILTAGELSTTLQIVNVDTNKKLYWFNDSSYLPIVDEECLRHWTIEDAREGDVLVDEDNNIGIFEGMEGMCWHSYIYLGCNNCLYGFSTGGSHMQNNTKPATKSQCGNLFGKMREKGYEWDVHNKELKLLITNGGDFFESENCEQNHDWSEEDTFRTSVLTDVVKSGGSIRPELRNEFVDWLKSLKDRYTWKPTDEQMDELENEYLKSIPKY